MGKAASPSHPPPPPLSSSSSSSSSSTRVAMEATGEERTVATQPSLAPASPRPETLGAVEEMKESASHTSHDEITKTLPNKFSSSSSNQEILTLSTLPTLQLYSDAAESEKDGRISIKTAPKMENKNNKKGEKRRDKKSSSSSSTNNNNKNSNSSRTTAKNKKPNLNNSNQDDVVNRGGRELVMGLPLSTWSHRENDSTSIGSGIARTSPPSALVTATITTSKPSLSFATPIAAAVTTSSSSTSTSYHFSTSLPPLPHLVIDRLPSLLLPQPPPLPPLLSSSHKRNNIHPISPFDASSSLSSSTQQPHQFFHHHSYNDYNKFHSLPDYPASSKSHQLSPSQTSTSYKVDRNQISAVDIHGGRQFVQEYNSHSSRDRKQKHSNSSQLVHSSSDAHSPSCHQHQPRPIDSLSLIESSGHDSNHQHQFDRHHYDGHSESLQSHPKDMTPAVFHPRKKHRAHASAGIYAPRKNRSERISDISEPQKRLQRSRLGVEYNEDEEADIEMEADEKYEEEGMNQELNEKLKIQTEIPTSTRSSRRNSSAKLSPASISPPTTSYSPGHSSKRRRVRIGVACDPCRAFKRRCSGGLPCDLCLRRTRTQDCKYDPGPASPMQIRNAFDAATKAAAKAATSTRNGHLFSQGDTVAATPKSISRRDQEEDTAFNGKKEGLIHRSKRSQYKSMSSEPQKQSRSDVQEEKEGVKTSRNISHFEGNEQEKDGEETSTDSEYSIGFEFDDDDDDNGYDNKEREKVKNASSPRHEYSPDSLSQPIKSLGPYGSPDNISGAPPLPPLHSETRHHERFFPVQVGPYSNGSCYYNDRNVPPHPHYYSAQGRVGDQGYWSYQEVPPYHPSTYRARSTSLTTSPPLGNSLTPFLPPHLNSMIPVPHHYSVAPHSSSSPYPSYYPHPAKHSPPSYHLSHSTETSARRQYSGGVDGTTAPAPAVNSDGMMAPVVPSQMSSHSAGVNSEHHRDGSSEQQTTKSIAGSMDPPPPPRRPSKARLTIKLAEAKDDHQQHQKGHHITTLTKCDAAPQDSTEEKSTILSQRLLQESMEATANPNTVAFEGLPQQHQQSLHFSPQVSQVLPHQDNETFDALSQLAEASEKVKEVLDEDVPVVKKEEPTQLRRSARSRAKSLAKSKD